MENFNGIPIYIATKTIQRRKHRKWRTNKKWLKRYGVIELNYMPIGTPMYVDGVIWMTKRDFEKLGLNDKSRIIRPQDTFCWNCGAEIMRENKE